MPSETAVGRSAPLSTKIPSSKSKKRKREHADSTYLREPAIASDSCRRSLPVYGNTKFSSHFARNQDQSQQSNASDGLQPSTLRTFKSKSLSTDLVRPLSDNGQLKQKAKSLEFFRKSLPIVSHLEEIRETLLEKDVVILVGETGSGKSTQVPQALVSEPWCRPQSVIVPRDASGQKVTSDGGLSPRSATVSMDRTTQTVTVGGCIAITEPRRVAATTLARRVAEEMGTALGRYSPKSTVGYSVRFDQSTSPNTRIKFLTEGILLQEILRDPWLKNYSVVLVDEVHERGANVDLLLGFLRNMVVGKNEGRGGVPLKVCWFSEALLLLRNSRWDHKTCYKAGNSLLFVLSPESLVNDVYLRIWKRVIFPSCASTACVIINFLS